MAGEAQPELALQRRPAAATPRARTRGVHARHGGVPRVRLPGVGLGLGIALTWLSLLVLLPIAALLTQALGLPWSRWQAVLAEPRVLASFRLSFLAALGAAAITLVTGPLIAWVLVRYRFPGRWLMDALIDLPFALPTAVAGIALTTLYAPHGWIGRHLPFPVAYTPLGVVVALVFVSSPFVVRMVQPALERIAASGHALEEAAWTLGASRWTVLRRVLLPELLPGLCAGMAMAVARGIGEYGSVIFIAGNLPLRTEIAPLVIVTHLEEFDDQGAAVIAIVLLATSILLLSAISVLERWSGRGRHA